MIPGALAGICLLITSIFLIYSREIVMGVIPILFVLIAVSAMAYEPWSIKRKLRKSPFKGQEVEVSITDESFDFSSSLATISLKWRVFTKVVCFKDGILLFQGLHIFSWIPYACLRTGSNQQLEELVRKHVPPNKVEQAAS
jgi:hypothetical protein